MKVNLGPVEWSCERLKKSKFAGTKDQLEGNINVQEYMCIEGIQDLSNTNNLLEMSYS